ncbi:hypothetical protein HF313_00280 [Massilia atriviolacea]|uniref:Uncharacterized protein n=1 Tax=Massilia atriviolacea TaxID=2495579 RepID=A0A430HKX3_9BURK|nr:hypothetical protein [Massilia atriviolacea]RSZ58178.1 hypothetical protein EJB06_14510 [Massilia atriviolacea]
MFSSSYSHRAAVVLFTSLVMAGCAARPETLRRPANERVLQIKETVTWKLGFWDVALVPGTYVEKYEDDAGAYFMGPPMCVYMAGRPRKEDALAGNAWECGILLPKKPGNEPTVVHIIGTQRPLTVFHADDTPDFSAVAPRAPRPDGTFDVSTTINSMPVLTVPGIAAGALTGAALGAILEAEQGTFRDFKTQPAKGWLVQTPASAAEAPARSGVP